MARDEDEETAALVQTIFQYLPALQTGSFGLGLFDVTVLGETPDIQLALVTPADATGPVPVVLMFRGGGLGQALGTAPPPTRPGFTPPQLPAASDPPATDQLVADGWGYGFLNPASIQADNGAGLTRGVIGLVNRGQPRKPDDWGALRAWSWGAARALDYLETDPAVDAKRVGIDGADMQKLAAHLWNKRRIIVVPILFLVLLVKLLVGRKSTTGAPLAPAGWLADPAGRHELRYWSATAWTAHVSDSGAQSEDPL